MNPFRVMRRRREALPPSADERESADDQVQALQAANAVNAWASLDTALYERIVPVLRKL